MGQSSRCSSPSEVAEFGQHRRWGPAPAGSWAGRLARPSRAASTEPIFLIFRGVRPNRGRAIGVPTHTRSVWPWAKWDSPGLVLAHQSPITQCEDFDLIEWI